MNFLDFSTDIYNQREIEFWKKRLQDVLEKFPVENDEQILGIPPDILKKMQKRLENVEEADLGPGIAGLFDPVEEEIRIAYGSEKKYLKHAFKYIGLYTLALTAAIYSGLVFVGEDPKTAAEEAGRTGLIFLLIQLPGIETQVRGKAVARHEAIHARHLYDVLKYTGALDRVPTQTDLAKVLYVISSSSGSIGEYLTVIQTHLESTGMKDRMESGAYAALYLVYYPFSKIFKQDLWEEPLGTTNPFKAVYRGIKLFRFMKKVYQYLPPWVAQDRLEDFYKYIENHKKFNKREKEYLLKVFRRFEKERRTFVEKEGLYPRTALELALMKNYREFFEGDLKHPSRAIYVNIGGRPSERNSGSPGSV